jgi:hypothetical protein
MIYQRRRHHKPGSANPPVTLANNMGGSGAATMRKALQAFENMTGDDADEAKASRQ